MIAIAPYSPVLKNNGSVYCSPLNSGCTSAPQNSVTMQSAQSPEDDQEASRSLLKIVQSISKFGKSIVQQLNWLVPSSAVLGTFFGMWKISTAKKAENSQIVSHKPKTFA
jgi:hypothetical protein